MTHILSKHTRSILNATFVNIKIKYKDYYFACNLCEQYFEEKNNYDETHIVKAFHSPYSIASLDCPCLLARIILSMQCLRA